MIRIEDLILIFYIWIPNKKIKGVIKKNPILIVLLNIDCKARYDVTNTKC